MSEAQLEGLYAGLTRLATLPEDELHALQDTGAHYGQGFLFARPAYPMPAVTWPPAVA